MNANELANELSKWYEDYDGRFDLIEEAATMLRQQVKELTDEEIEEVWMMLYSLDPTTLTFNKFARAILRKAQEK